MNKKFLIKMDDKTSPLNYEILDQDSDEALYSFISSKITKKFTLSRNNAIFAYHIGKKEFAGILSVIYEENGKYFTRQGEKYYPLPL